jgi:hypothetical protein
MLASEVSKPSVKPTTFPLDFLTNTFPSAVLTANSPADKLAADGIAPDVADRLSWII